VGITGCPTRSEGDSYWWDGGVAGGSLAPWLLLRPAWHEALPQMQRGPCQRRPCKQPCQATYLITDPAPTPATTGTNYTHTIAAAPWNRRTNTPCKDRCARRSAGKLRPKGAGKPLTGDPWKCRTNQGRQLKRQSQPRPQPEAGGRRQAGAPRDISWMCGNAPSGWRAGKEHRSLAPWLLQAGLAACPCSRNPGRARPAMQKAVPSPPYHSLNCRTLQKRPGPSTP
jgi:hypothetical protein